MMPAKQNSSLTPLQFLLEGMLEVDSGLLVAGLSVDARNIQKNDVFLAVAGTQQHGLMYAEQAVQAGAVAIIYDPESGGDFLAEKVKKKHNVCLLRLPKLNEHISMIAARLYKCPSNELSVIGITGTNGKTSVSHFIGKALGGDEGACGVIGTLGWGRVEELKKTINTTPDAVSVQQQLAALLDEGVTKVAMEVSSHGLDQGRVNAVEFKGAVFTNLSHDHLDYHQTIEAYGEAKLALFKCPSLQFVVLNQDDDFSNSIKKTLRPNVKVYTFSRSEKCVAIENCLRISNEQLISTGLSFDLSLSGCTRRINSGLFGAFNIDNIVATIASLIAMGDGFEAAVAKAEKATGVDGRMQRVIAESSTHVPTVVVDYAHTPDALKLALLSLREHCEGTLRLVFGCGGNRDESKRPLMGAIAAELADSVVITTDNPRFESASTIAEQIKVGVEGRADLNVILDRGEAIKQTIAMAPEDDIILVAGKGHEDYQQIKDEKITFSDVAHVKEALKSRVLADEGDGGCKP